MPEPDPAKPPVLTGRFVVKLDGTTHTGLTAHEVVELLDDNSAASPAVYRIHRVDEAGRMELVGVAPAAFDQCDGLLFRRRRIEDARADYDAVVELARRVPPPCRIDVRLSCVEDQPLPHVVVLVFPHPCSESVGAWLDGCASRLGDEVGGSAAALADCESAVQHVDLRQTLEPSAAAD